VPLREGSDDDTVSSNIRQLREDGYPEDQAVAIAYKKAGRARGQRTDHARSQQFRLSLQRAGFQELPRFAVLDEHVHVRDDGKGVEHFTPDRLQRLADKLNHRVENTGDPPAICVGHTGRVARDKPSVGTPMDFAVEPLYGTGKQAIWCTPFARNGEVETFRKFNRRSVELWTGGPDGDDIDPIALLGADAPRRNLGLHLFSRTGGETSYHYSREVEGDDEMGNNGNQGAAASTRVGDMNVEQLASALAPALAKSQEFAPLFQLQDEIGGLLQQEDQFMGGASGGTYPGGGMQPGMGMPMGGGMPQQMAGGYPQQFSRGYGPDAYGQFVPDPYRPGYGTYTPPPPQVPYRSSPTRAGSGGEPSQPQQFQKMLDDAVAKALKPMDEQLKLQKERADLSEIESQLRTLAAVERVRFDYQKELDHLKSLLPEQRAVHFQRMRDNYARLSPYDPVPQVGSAPGSFAVPQDQQAPTTAPHPAFGHGPTVGAAMPDGTAPVYMGRGAPVYRPDAAVDESVFQGLDPFEVAAQAGRDKVDFGRTPVNQYVAQFRRPQQQAAGQQQQQQAQGQAGANGQVPPVEKVR
jgi:hypothetical protein